jgi:DNA-binding MarR family transcriptional regulator
VTKTVDAVDEVREAFSDVLGAERRLRGRDAHSPDKLSNAHVRALFVLAAEEEATAGQLAKAAGLNPASVTGMLDHLEREGIVQRRRSETDRRQVLVTLTASGAELLEVKRARWRARWTDTLEGVPPEDLAAAARVLRAVATMIDEI